MLTYFLRHLDPRARVKRRRRIYAMADRWAAYLMEKYGDRGEALSRCREHLVATSKRDSGVRNYIWCKVYNGLQEYSHNP